MRITRTRFIAGLALLAGLAACRADEMAHGPQWMFPTQVRGSGVTTSLEHVLGAPFTRLEVDGSLDVSVKPAAAGAPARVLVEGDDNLVGKVLVEVRGSTLWLRPEDGNLRPLAGLRATVEAPSYDTLVLRGSGEVTFEGFAAGALSVEVFGTGSVKGSGEVNSLRVRVHGSGDADLIAMKSGQTSVEIQGSGDARVTARAQARVDIHGSGDVHLYGEPTDWTWTIRGSGQVFFVDPRGNERLAPTGRPVSAPK